MSATTTLNAPLQGNRQYSAPAIRYPLFFLGFPIAPRFLITTVVILFVGAVQALSAYSPVDVLPPSDTCRIDAIELVKLEDCTPDTEGVTAVLDIRHSNAPGTGSLIVNELTFPLGGSSQTVWLPLERNGASITVTAFFSADSSCRFTAPELFSVPAGSCVGSCRIDSIALLELEDCIDGEARVNARLRVWHSGNEEQGWLVVNGFSFAVKDSVQDVRLPLDRNGASVSIEAYFSEASDCALSVPDLFKVPEGPCRPCSITSVELIEAPACIPRGEIASARLRVSYEAPPGSGWLLINGYNFALTGSPQLVKLPVGPDQGPINANVYFSEATDCRLFKLAAIPDIPACPPPLARRCADTVSLPVALSGKCEAPTNIDFPEILPLDDWPGGCAPYLGNEHWSRLIVPESGELRLRARPDSTDARLALQLFQHCSREAIACAYAELPGQAVVLTIKDQLPGDTLLLATWSDADGGAELCAFLPTAPPPNDRCAGARPLPLSDPLLGQSCNNSVPLDWRGALHHGAPAPCGEEMTGGDIWFEVVVPEGGKVLLRLLGEEAAKVAIAAYSACGGAFLGCSTPDELDRPSLLLRDLPAGRRVLLQVYRTAATDGLVELCASMPPAAIDNDDCSKARRLIVGPTELCSAPVYIGNVSTTPSGTPVSCTDDPPIDLWYQVVVPPDGAVTIELATYHGLITPGLAIFDGCAGQELACTVPGPSPAILTLTERSPGDTLWIAAWEAFGFKFGTASLCAYEPAPPPNDNCSNAYFLPLCPGSDCVATPVATGGTTNLYAPAIPCRESNAALWWFEVRADKNGRLAFEAPDTVRQGGMAAFSSCGGELLACTAFAEEGPRLALPDLLPGETILLAVWSPYEEIGLRAWAPECPAMLFEADIQTVSCAGGNDGSIRLYPNSRPDIYRYQWSTGATTAWADSLSAGRYEVAIIDPYGCRDSLQGIVEEPAPLTVTIETSAATSAGDDGALRVVASGGTTPYFYRLESGDLQKDSLFNRLAPGAYTLLVVDSQGCSSWQTVVIDQSTALTMPSELESMTLYPNPNRGQLQLDIRLLEPLALQLEIWSAAGQRLLWRTTDRAPSHRLQWTLAALPDGLYLLRMKVANGWVSRRFVLAR